MLRPSKLPEAERRSAVGVSDFVASGFGVFFLGGLKMSDLFKGFRMVFWILFWLHGFLRCSCFFFGRDEDWTF